MSILGPVYIITGLVAYIALLAAWIKGRVNINITFEGGLPLPGWAIPVGLWVVALLWPLMILAFIKGRLWPD